MRLSDFFQSIRRGFSSSSGRRTKAAKWASESAEVLEFRELMTAQVTQFADLNVAPETASSDPQELTAIGNTVYFTAVDKTHGRELWKKTGANAAVLVKDIFVGTANSGLRELTAVGSTLFFLADDGIHGEELWKSDGTAAGTVLVKDHVRGSSNWGAGGDLLTNVNGKLFYRSGTHFNPDGHVIVPYLISSDGTEAGTDIPSWNPTFFYGEHSEIVGLGTQAIFVGMGNGLWKSDGTGAGTQALNMSGVLFPRNLTVVDANVYFTGYNEATGTEIWKTDGNTVTQVTSFTAANPELSNLVNANGTLYFSANEAATGQELWKTNGTIAGTQLVSDIRTGANSGSPSNLTVVGSTVYFRANDGVTGDELWKSDGTAAGTVRVGHGGTTSNFSPRNLTNVGGTLYFTATTNETGYEVWKSDGTAGGTNVYQELVAGSGSSLPQQLTNVNGALVFSADNGITGRELWRYDLAANTSAVSDINRGTLSSAPRNFVQVGNNVFFLANIASDQSKGEELWKVGLNGTGAVKVKDVSWHFESSSRITEMTNVNGTLYFSANDPTFGIQLWKSDGTEAGTVMVSEAMAQNGSTSPSGLSNLNGKLIFTATGADGHELWTSDGSAAGTVRLKDIAAGANSGITPSSSRFVVNGSTAYFFANDGISGRELWKTDGTAAGTVLVKDVNAGAASSNPSQLINVDGLLYFLADDGINGTEIWQSDGTAAGTLLVANLDVNWLDQLTAGGGKLYFTANGEIWCRSTPTSAPFLLREIGEGPGWGGDPTSLTAVGSTLFFTAVYATSDPRVGLGRELWKTDGTSAGTVLVKDIVNIPQSLQNGFQWSSNPTNLINNNGTLFFTANDMINGQELWMSDGTAAGTTLFHDFTGDAGSSHPQNLAAINGRIFASVMSEATGREGVSVIDVFTPASPSITAPATGTTQSQRPTITWSASAGAVSYDVFIKNNSTGANPQVSVNVAGLSYVPTADLGIGKYTIWVRAVSSGGTKSPWSAARDITINTGVTQAPMIRNQTTNRPFVVWKDLPGAVKYSVYLQNVTPNEPSIETFNDIRGKSWQSSTDLKLGTYRVWVRGVDASGLAAAWSTQMQFTVSTPPGMISPVSSTFEARPQFSWLPVTGATKYSVYIKNLNTETVVYNQTNIATTNWTPPANLANGHYIWQVVAASNNAQGLWSAPQTFTVGGRPEVTGPVSNSNDTTPTFTWKQLTGAVSYQLWVDRVDSYVQAVINVNNLTGTSYTPATALPIGTYRVWMRAVSVAGVTSDWSEPLTFVIVS
ncbi:MAG: ELWxxDGT repeat protein [Planctomycetaceae bacterium]